ncbi:MAG: nucleoside triphosphate pyrophosphohydrolase [Spirochaetaceae bacterium]|jgi:tetrapyrrole methylase family protein/MazG family protein|nr:nucleoside triphosphate pyrophosphohydrolase [Spirochaetaceae bacterium]
MNQKTEGAAAFERFLGIIRRLRAPGGCPWDIEQTPLSLRSSLVEEAFEAVDAISCKDAAHTEEELGDVILNCVMIALMHEEAGDFSVSHLFDELSAKLVRRHPHVFSESEAREYLAAYSGNPEETTRRLNPEEVLAQWDVIKDGLENRKGESILDGITPGFPPLLKAYKIQKKAAKRGFDWQKPDEALEKVREEFAEVKGAAENLSALGAAEKPFTAQAGSALDAAQLALEEELGDLFFSLVNWARHLGVDPEVALSRANAKFSRRFREIEGAAAAEGKPMEALSLEQLDQYWKRVKNNEKKE